MSITFAQATPFPPLTVSAAGMSTALGGMVAGCAAARAGILRIQEVTPPEDPPGLGAVAMAQESITPPEIGAGADAGQEAASNSQGATEEEKPERLGPYLGHRVRDVPDEIQGMDRLAGLATLALQDLFSTLTDPARELGRYAFILCLPSGYLSWAHAALEGPAPQAFSSGVFLNPREAEYLAEIQESIIPRIFSAFPDLPRPIWTGIVLEDQAGFSEGVTRAAALLTQGRADSCLLGGVDSRILFQDRRALEDLGLVMTDDFPAGFVPGEGAAFLQLRPPHWTGESLASIQAAAQAAEPEHRLSGSPPVAEALTQVARAALQNAGGGQRPFLVLSPVNGSPWISCEWGYLLARVPTLAEGDYLYPAAAFGEMGAANGPVATCMAIRGFVRGYLGQHGAMVVLSAECGRKGAVMIRRPATPGGST